MEQTKLNELKAAAAQIRLGALEGIHAAKSGHPGGSLSIADIMAYLYFYKMKNNPVNPNDPDRDRFEEALFRAVYKNELLRVLSW